jgi:hypothetical protein
MSERRFAATVSGSFRRALPAVQDAVYALTDMGVRVLSPADPRVVDQFGEFLFVASDRLRTIRLVENRHLAAVEASDFVWLVAPDGYVGLSAAMELGYARAVRTPVYSDTAPSDLTLRQYVRIIASLKDVLLDLRAPGRRKPAGAILEPDSAIERAHRKLEAVRAELTHPVDPTDDRRLQEVLRSTAKVLDGI